MRITEGRGDWRLGFGGGPLMSTGWNGMRFNHGRHGIHGRHGKGMINEDA